MLYLFIDVHDQLLNIINIYAFESDDSDLLINDTDLLLYITLLNIIFIFD
jgi:hypothetical protein